jgi:hypothetical protein
MVSQFKATYINMTKSIYKFDASQHIHTLNGKPLTGTSSVGNVLAKPLTYWASGKACEVFGWTNPKKVEREERIKIAEEKFDEMKELSISEYLSLLDTAYKAHATNLKKTAKKGTDLHSILERYVKIQMGKEADPLTDEETKLIQKYIDWADENVKSYLWSEAHCYSEELWVGGISDLGIELKDGSYAVGDFKSSSDVYVNQYIQVSLYAIQINENGLFSVDGEHNKKLDKPVEKLVIFPFGAESLPKKLIRSLDVYEKGARSAVELYRLMGLENNN